MLNSIRSKQTADLMDWAGNVSSYVLQPLTPGDCLLYVCSLSCSEGVLPDERWFNVSQKYLYWWGVSPADLLGHHYNDEGWRELSDWSGEEQAVVWPVTTPMSAGYYCCSRLTGTCPGLTPVHTLPWPCGLTDCNLLMEHDLTQVVSEPWASVSRAGASVECKDNCVSAPAGQPELSRSRAVSSQGCADWWYLHFYSYWRNAERERNVMFV